jgi:hypothetical protein
MATGQINRSSLIHAPGKQPLRSPTFGLPSIGARRDDSGSQQQQEAPAWGRGSLLPTDRRHVDVPSVACRFGWRCNVSTLDRRRSSVKSYSWFSTHSDGGMTSTSIASLVHHTCSASQYGQYERVRTWGSVSMVVVSTWMPVENFVPVAGHLASKTPIL